ncbi:serine protease 33-like [Leopardus geoffroyi]|uniref:serine protease 33-like n=1 Tax=Leopardus geoffroyi TaxID=46844 RepID=UPI001E2660C7|nr:serine protease 33-like [Leopardus geoffroyi]
MPETLNVLGWWGGGQTRWGRDPGPAMQMLPVLLLLSGAGIRPAEANSRKGPAAWPWQASIFLDARYRCEGALISQEWVLTGASCFSSGSRSQFRVTLGPDRLVLDSCKGISRVEELLLSPGGSEGSASGGLALARLARPLPLSSAVQPVPLAARPQPFLPRLLCWAQGFEADIDPYIPPRELHSVPLRPLHIHTCKDAFRLHPDCPDPEASLPEGSQCTKPPTGPSELVVSDGSPLVCFQANSWLLQGVITWGPCWGPGLPEVYRPVHPFISWIRDKVSNATFPTLAKKRPWARPGTRQRRQ